MTTSVYDLFAATFPWSRSLTDDEHDSMSSMPVASNCGRDCRKAIESAKALLGHAKAAYGAPGGRLVHPKGDRIRAEVADAVRDIVLCYICG